MNDGISNENSILKDIIRIETDKSSLEDNLDNQRILLSNSRRVKNITIFKSVSKLMTPLVLSSLVIIGISNFGKLGKPFVLDKEKYSKVYYIESDEEKGITALEYYKNIKKDKESFDNTFTIISPWKQENQEYVRTIYNYDEKTNYDINLYNSIIKKDIDYIYSNYKPQSSSIETCSYIEDIDNELKINAKIYIIDKNDNIYVVESNTKNYIVTIIELLSIVTAISLVIVGIKDNIIIELRKNISSYNEKKSKYEELVNKIDMLNVELSQLENKVKKYEK